MIKYYITVNIFIDDVFVKTAEFNKFESFSFQNEILKSVEYYNVSSLFMSDIKIEPDGHVFMKCNIISNKEKLDEEEEKNEQN